MLYQGGFGLYLRGQGQHTRLIYNISDRLSLDNGSLVGAIGRRVRQLSGLSRFEQGFFNCLRVHRVIELGLFGPDNGDARELRYVPTWGVHGRATWRYYHHHGVPVNDSGKFLYSIGCGDRFAVGLFIFKVRGIEFSFIHVAMAYGVETCKVRVVTTKVTSGGVRGGTNSSSGGYDRRDCTPLRK